MSITTTTFYVLLVSVSLFLLRLSLLALRSLQKQRKLVADASALLNSGDYAGARQKFSEIIRTSLGRKHPGMYLNRAACNLKMSMRYEESLADAKKAIQLDGRIGAAWYIRGTCEDCLGHFHESVQSYKQAVSLASSSQLSKQYSEALERAEEMIALSYRPGIIPLHIMKPMARAHDISLPPLSSPEKINEIYKTLSTHPLFGTEPKLRLLLIPESQTAPLTQHELSRGPGIDLARQIATLLGCSTTESVMLYSEDQIALAKGSPTGVEVGRLHTIYEAWMDDDAIEKRPVNKRASQLLHRPDTHGPILVQKTTLLKSDTSMSVKSKDIICFERVDEEELLSDDFVDLRAEWVRVKGAGDAPTEVHVA
ncbi:hypothetical protein FB451DRAFT_1359887 [Mycena latifolia]|nr:hypothetical protein FB451DRAFT_1359887 [Mycena latifolia]